MKIFDLVVESIAGIFLVSVVGVMSYFGYQYYQRGEFFIASIIFGVIIIFLRFWIYLSSD